MKATHERIAPFKFFTETGKCVAAFDNENAARMFQDAYHKGFSDGKESVKTDSFHVGTLSGNLVNERSQAFQDIREMIEDFQGNFIRKSELLERLSR